MNAKRPNKCSTDWPRFPDVSLAGEPEGNESVLVQPSLIVTGGNRQAKRQAIEANEYLGLAPSAGD